MDAVGGLTFGEPRWLLALVGVLPLAWWLVARERLRRRLSARFISERLRGEPLSLRGWRPYLLAVALAATALALAAPRFGTEKRVVAVSTHNRVLVIDLSNSMLARDVGTSRLDAAKSLLQRVLSGTGGRIALVAFEKRAEVVSPLTTDTEAVASLLETLATGETPEGGSDIGEGVRTAIVAADVTEARAADVVVVSDGEDQGSSVDLAINDARMRRVRVHTIMVGTAEGSNIVADEGPLRDEEGVEIRTQASATALQRLARQTGGEFFSNPFSAGAVARLEQTLRHRAIASSDQQEVQVPLERYQWPLSLAAFAALLASFIHRGAA